MTHSSSFLLSDAWKAAYPNAHAGILAIHNAANPAHHPALEQRKAALEQDLRARYAGQDRIGLLRNPILQAYDTYYRQFKKTYHVQLQLESILIKGKAIPSVAALVEAMFMAEIDGLLLTAGHDLDTVQLPLTLDVATGNESYTLLRGDPQVPKAGDMLIRDAVGVISSIVYGPDQRTQLTTGTHNVVFTVYAPAGISPQNIQRQLEKMRDNILLIAPEAIVQSLLVVGAD